MSSIFLSWCVYYFTIFGIGFSVFLCMMWLKSLAVLCLCMVVGVFQKNNYLSVLLCLEGLVVVSVLVLVSHAELFFAVCLISIGSCESALGLACLVCLVRHQGSAYMSC